jgi:hypothetical protein
MYMTSKTAGLFGSAFISLLSAFAALAQQATPTPATAIDQDNGDDIFFVVKLTAKELKMDVVPNTKVEFPGTQRRTTAWLTERSNLPDKLEPGVTYRDIGITLRISSRFENIDEIVREALGEPPAASSEPVSPPPAVAASAKIETPIAPKRIARRSPRR